VCGGELTVHVTPGLASQCDDQGKEAVFIRITQGQRALWEPDAPLCLSPLYEADSTAGFNADDFELDQGSVRFDEGIARAYGLLAYYAMSADVLDELHRLARKSSARRR